MFSQLNGTGEGDSMLINSQLLNYPSPTMPPISFVLTEFHVLLLYSDHVTAISILSQSIVFEDIYDEVLILGLKYKRNSF